jgi:hypothetical protein
MASGKYLNDLLRFPLKLVWAPFRVIVCHRHHIAPSGSIVKLDEGPPAEGGSGGI